MEYLGKKNCDTSSKIRYTIKTSIYILYIYKPGTCLSSISRFEPLEEKAFFNQNKGHQKGFQACMDTRSLSEFLCKFEWPSCLLLFESTRVILKNMRKCFEITKDIQGSSSKQMI